jgi:hypothetical protein
MSVKYFAVKGGNFMVRGIKYLLPMMLIVFVTLNAEEKTFKYVGVKKCKICHKQEKYGNQYGKWLETKHSKAYEALASEKAKEIAKEKGIEDPQKSEKCLKCHVTAYGVSDDLKEKTLTLEEGVSCEACHGPGSEYKKLNVMKKLTADEIEPASVGLVVPTEETCKGCHNEESPTYKSFDFEKYKAEIEHPLPKK